MRTGTDSRLSGSYALLVFDSERCVADALCVMSTNLTSAAATTLLGSRSVHELLASGSQASNGVVQLPDDVDSADGTMRLLFNTTSNAAPASAAELLNAPWSNDRVVAGSEDTKPRKCTSKNKKSRRRCRARSSTGNSTLDFLNGNDESGAGVVVMVGSTLGWAATGFAMLIAV